MTETARVHEVILDYRARFERPQISLISTELQRAFEGVVQALLPFGFKLSNSEIVTGANPAEQRWIFRLRDRGISFEFGPEEYRFSKVHFEWGGSSADLAVLFAAVEALGAERVVKAENSVLTISMHAQPLTLARADLLAPLTPVPFRGLLGSNAASFGGCITRLDGYEVLVEESGTYSNGVFFRFTVTPHPGEPVSKVSDRAHHLQGESFAALGLEEKLRA